MCSVRIEPNTATDTDAATMVCTWLPIQTISIGARADFGRLFNMTRYGSRISDALRLDHKSTAARIPTTVTIKKLNTVSNNVIPMWEKILPSRTIFQKQKRTLEGELNMKSSIISSLVQSSQRARNKTRSILLMILTFLLCSFSCSIYAS